MEQGQLARRLGAAIHGDGLQNRAMQEMGIPNNAIIA